MGTAMGDKSISFRSLFAALLTWALSRLRWQSLLFELPTAERSLKTHKTDSEAPVLATY
jgi:hypothetical protein